ncbi:MAG: hypothetical protein IRY95_00870 [Clostridia bacterium]|nr:hypothetical protein [Clostridia bacterium]
MAARRAPAPPAAPAGRPRRRWTAAEDEVLRRQVQALARQSATLTEVAERLEGVLGRDPASILRRVRQLRRRDPGFERLVGPGRRTKEGLLEAPEGPETPGGSDGPGDASAGVIDGERTSLARQLLLSRCGRLSERGEERLSRLVARHGELAVTGALAHVLMRLADVALEETAAELAERVRQGKRRLAPGGRGRRRPARA